MSPAWVKATGTARVQNDLPVSVEREHPLIAAVDIHQITGRLRLRPRGSVIRRSWLNGPARSPSAEKQRSVPYPSPFAPLALVTTIRIMTWLGPLWPAK